ncbi:hypothetical protein C8Q80DRAFT_271540 [Daedaleopsis nitida]|nr:hypothetical protein C8Q80DRAFT_271540 [Daedaleopsis nitida]
MKSAFRTIRLGHSAVAHKQNKRDGDGCNTGGLYKTPTKDQTVDTSEPVQVSWDTSCLDTDLVDLYLYAPYSASPGMNKWTKVNYALGSYNATLKSGWWNNTSPMMLQFTIVPNGVLPFMVDTPAGPIFSAINSGTTDSDTTTVAGGVVEVNNVPVAEHGISKGGVAAAVIIPLLLVIAIGVAVYIKKTRQRVKDKRKRFSEMVDRRMSTISTDWKSITGAGANAAIRNSMAVPGNRASSFSFGAIRPESTFTVEGGQAGIGAQGMDYPVVEPPPMSQLRPGVRTSAFENRTSRVSFAADPRPSTESRRARQSRAFHVSQAPPLPFRQESTESSSNSSPILSPVQTAGPLTLTSEDIRARMAGQETAPRPSIDEVMPAISMMRTGEQGGTADDLLFKTPMPSPPSPTLQVPKSPIMGAMPMQPMPASVMSPDDMLRAYAERRAMGSAVPGAPALPTPIANFNGTGMRTLYSPDNQASQPTASRKSLAPTEYSKYDDEDAYAE